MKADDEPTTFGMSDVLAIITGAFLAGILVLHRTHQIDTQKAEEAKLKVVTPPFEMNGLLVPRRTRKMCNFCKSKALAGEGIGCVLYGAHRAFGCPIEEDDGKKP